MSPLRPEDSKPGDKHARRGLQAFDESDWHAVVHELRKAIALGVAYHDLTELHVSLADAFERIGDYDASVAACLAAIERRPDHHVAWYYLGLAYFAQGKTKQAEESYRTAIEVRPDYAPPYSGLGAVFTNDGRSIEAVDLLRKAIALDPRMGTAYGNLALAQARLGRFEEAAATLGQAISFGYKNWREVHQRIENMKAYESLRSEGGVVDDEQDDKPDPRWAGRN